MEEYGRGRNNDLFSGRSHERLYQQAEALRDSPKHEDNEAFHFMKRA